MKLYDELRKYSNKNVLAMHMPGHKRKNIFGNELPYKLDITEIDGFDNLHNASGILKECQDKVTKLYKSRASFYLVNGSTSGVLSAINSICGIGDKILLTRNCHKSVFNIVELLNLEAIFLPLNIDDNGIISGINVEKSKDIIEKNKDAKAIIFPSPTYEGVICDVKSLSKIAHENGMILIVDEAHGAHLILEDNNAGKFGADIVINSLHKTLPSLTQTAVMHVYTERVSIKRVKKSISVFNSSSPSYILMSSIDECIEFMLKDGGKYIKELQNNLSYFYKKAKELKHLEILENKGEFFDFDKTKINVLTNKSNINGMELAQILRKYSIEIEMSYTNYCILMTTIFDSKEDLDRLINVLLQIDKDLTFKKNNLLKLDFEHKTIYKIGDAINKNTQSMNYLLSINHISAEYVWVYPPGIPILIPGEKITSEIIEYIKYLKENNLSVLSSSNIINKDLLYVLDNI